MYCESCMRNKAQIRVFFENNESFQVCWECARILSPHTTKLVERIKDSTGNNSSLERIDEDKEMGPILKESS